MLNAQCSMMNNAAMNNAVHQSDIGEAVPPLNIAR
jgi:hypothetical protein